MQVFEIKVEKRIRRGRNSCEGVELPIPSPRYLKNGVTETDAQSGLKTNARGPELDRVRRSRYAADVLRKIAAGKGNPIPSVRSRMSCKIGPPTEGEEVESALRPTCKVARLKPRIGYQISHGILP